MNSHVRTMLENMYALFSNAFHDPVKAWDYFIEFLAVDNCASLLYQLDHKFEWLMHDSKLMEAVKTTYDLKLLKSDYYDHLGEMYLEKFVSNAVAKRKGMILTPMTLADSLAKMTIREQDILINVLDPAVGTGRLLMAVHKRAPDANLFGVDIDLRSLRIAFTNFAIHNISGYLLHANSLIHDIDIATEQGRQNWRYANKWYSCMDKLKPEYVHPKSEPLLTIPKQNNSSQQNLFEK